MMFARFTADCGHELDEFLATFGGASLRGGLYRIVRSGDAGAWRDRIAIAFPEFSGRAMCFGFDWLGRAFALDTTRTEDGRAAVLMLDVGAGEALEISANVESFHDSERVGYTDAALAENFHRKWLRSAVRIRHSTNASAIKSRCSSGAPTS